jgi:aminoglycoside phosphotransferase (APT) family kinase protein
VVRRPERGPGPACHHDGVALTVQRELDTVVARLVAWLTEQRAARVVVDGVERPTDGWSSETVLVRARVDGIPEGFAVRLGPVGEGIFPTYDLGLQAHAQAVAHAGGVPTAVPAELVDNPQYGDPFLVMPLVEGHVPGEMAAFDPWVQGLAPARRSALYEGVVEALVVLHRTPLAAAARLPHRTVDHDLAWWTGYLDWYAEGDEAVPGLRAALDWCAAHRPAAGPPPAVLWGDVRLGNVVFADDDSVAALLDWEMATVGAPEHDVAWWWALEAMQDELVGGRAEGFPSITDLRARYEAGLGRPLQDLAWFEAFALFRSAAILTRIGIVQQRAGLTPRMPLGENPVLDHLARHLEAMA